MKYYTKAQLNRLFEQQECTSVEVIRYIDSSHRLHGDHIATVLNNYLDPANIDDLPGGEIECEWYAMDEDEYTQQILPGTDLCFQDMHEPGERIFIIALGDSTVKAMNLPDPDVYAISPDEDLDDIISTWNS